MRGNDARLPQSVLFSRVPLGVAHSLGGIHRVFLSRGARRREPSSLPSFRRSPENTPFECRFRASRKRTQGRCAVARIHALALALASGAKDERVGFVRDFLARKGIGRNFEESYFTGNLRRFIAEQAGYQKKLEDAAKGRDPSSVYLARGTLFETRGLS